MGKKNKKHAAVEAGDVPGPGAVEPGAASAPGHLPAVGLAQGASPKPEACVDRYEDLAAPASAVSPVAPKEPTRATDRLALADSLGVSEMEKKIADYHLDYPKAGPTAIGQVVGMGRKAVDAVLNKPAVAMYMSQYLERAGSGLDKSARVISEAHDAERETPVVFNGEITAVHKQPDHKTRLDAAKLNMQAHGALDERVQVNIYQSLTDEQLAQVRSGAARPDDFINGELA